MERNGAISVLPSKSRPHTSVYVSHRAKRGIATNPPPGAARRSQTKLPVGLKPTLRLTTVSAALQRMEQEVGPRIPEYEGEWTDWWANGVASGPRELSASRFAKRAATAAESPVWGPLDDAGKPPSTHSTGSLYRYVAPKLNASLPAGDFWSVAPT